LNEYKLFELNVCKVQKLSLIVFVNLGKQINKQIQYA